MSGATCPKCNGSTRRQMPPDLKGFRIAGYRAEDDTLACDNCGGQTMGGHATGTVSVDPSTGLGCLHEYSYRLAGNCYHEYTCKKCGSRHYIDSGD